ncbi:MULTISPECIES: FadR/GntR family transcriptional regulator [Falsihalocynthiibacter]|uniref:FadR/GntR family transcriptional regulator n=1 Tax=Falsihalocynthiibacter TaxID=2854182 RepID=UPI003001CCB7
MDYSTDKSSVTQTVARQLQEMIRSGSLAKDEKLPSQRVLSEQLGVSRTSLREALLTLETLGLVRTLPARGTFVVGINTQEARGQDPWRFDEQYSILDVFQSRMMIETEMCRLAAPHINDAVAQKLREVTDQFELAWTRGDLVTHVEADLMFHRLIAQACPNAMLRRLYHSVSDLLTESQRVPIPSTALARMNASMEEHRTILHALTRNRPEDAANAMQAHIRNTAACVGISI